MPRFGGSRIRHVHGENLKVLEEMLERLPWKAEVITINKVGSNWYIHYYLPLLTEEKKDSKIEAAEETKTVKKVRRRK